MKIEEKLIKVDRTEYSATLALDEILEYAAKIGASDIHIDPRDKDLFVRFRVDGQIEFAGIFCKEIHEEIISRLKILSGARTDVHSFPQDGRWRMQLQGIIYNLRISFMPTYYGENSVIRLLPTSDKNDLSLAKLGFTPEHVAKIDRALKKTSGIILVTGPTGSGKTTTLHTCVSLKSKQALSVVTLEDPVEYEIDGVRQILVRDSQGFTFASGLRSVLRQDPDVIMVGEIRDTETANVAIHTALTGHLVFSTLHTNSALETICRLTDMGIDNYLLSSTLKLIIAQRLVRTICDKCSQIGCVSCRYSGFRGRSVMTEVIEIDAHIKNLLSQNASQQKITEYIESTDFRSMLEDGFEKADWGLTTRDEVKRVLSE